MSMREADRLKTIQAVVDRMARVGQAAQRMGLSRRQLERLIQRYKEDGVAGLVSRRRGRPSNHQLAPGIAERAIGLIRERYADFGPTLACEKLSERHGLTLGVETVRALMTAAGLWTPRKQRAAKIHQPRNRRACVGELIQIDGSDHAWFEGRAPSCTLLVFIDDATSRLMQLHFVPTESAFAYFEATRGYIEQHGKPVAFYSDKASIFRSVRDSTDFGRGTTQFGRVLYELNIDIMCANSSQAKGRVERANLTLQDRLVKELRLRDISTQKAADAFAPHFIADFNARFAKPPLRDFDAHRPVRADEDLELLFTWRLQRKVSLSLTLQHDRIIYLLKDTVANRKLIHRYIDVYEYPDGRIELRADGANLIYERYDRLPQVDTAAIVENKRLSHALQAALVIQAQRDDRRKSSTPSRTNQGQAPYSTKALPGTKRSRQFTSQDLNEAVKAVCRASKKSTVLACG
ncbi:ISNCY family transposase [Variovorax sp. 38R]|uniref:ISNCY family transposase n=1 Tax=Variovorax sp. 38R TaxID=2774875 RepID=UPI001CE09F4C|nr:ISNCY family transposase [Variovorax sp. 38R]